MGRQHSLAVVTRFLLDLVFVYGEPLAAPAQVLAVSVVAHRALVLKLANESRVLLKNDGVVPLKISGLKVAVIGHWRIRRRCCWQLQRDTDAYGFDPGGDQERLSWREHDLYRGNAVVFVWIWT